MRNGRGAVAKQGGNVMGYVCTPAGELIHALPANLNATQYRSELEWGVALADALEKVRPSKRAGWAQRAHQRALGSSQQVLIRCGRGQAPTQTRQVHTFLASNPLPRIRDVEQTLFTGILGETFQPAAPITIVRNPGLRGR